MFQPVESVDGVFLYSKNLTDSPDLDLAQITTLLIDSFNVYFKLGFIFHMRKQQSPLRLSQRDFTSESDFTFSPPSLCTEENGWDSTGFTTSTRSGRRSVFFDGKLFKKAQQPAGEEDRNQQKKHMLLSRHGYRCHMSRQYHAIHCLFDLFVIIWTYSERLWYQLLKCVKTSVDVF